MGAGVRKRESGQTKGIGMRIRLLALAFCLVAEPAAAQQQDMNQIEVKVERLAPGVAVLIGAGGNIGLSYGQDGNIIVDDQYAPMSDRILAAIATVDPTPSASSSTPTGTATIPAETKRWAAAER